MKQNPQMITGSWDDVTLVCGNTHEQPVEMVLQEGPQRDPIQVAEARR